MSKTRNSCTAQPRLSCEPARVDRPQLLLCATSARRSQARALAYSRRLGTGLSPAPLARPSATRPWDSRTSLRLQELSVPVTPATVSDVVTPVRPLEAARRSFMRGFHTPLDRSDRRFQREGPGQKNPYQWPRQGSERQVPSPQQGYLGVGMITVTADLQQRYHLSTATGALVLSVDHTGPASQTGVRRGDVITSIDGASVTTQQDVLNAVTAKKAGDSVTIVLGACREKATAKIDVVPPLL